MTPVTIEEVLKCWTLDAVVEESQLSSELIKIPMLHSKYLNYYIHFKQQLSKASAKKNKMSFLRKRYYRGECTKEELINNNWEQYQGLKMSNTEYNSHSVIDPILVDYTRAVEELDLSVKGCEYILGQLKNRSWELKSVIEYNKYLGGN